MEEEQNKQIIGILGEMHLAMMLHKRGWQVYRAYIDSNVDFILTKYWCGNCDKYAEIERRKKTKGSGEFPTDRCSVCLKPSLEFVVRFVQVKTSEGIPRDSSLNRRTYSFHAKLRSNIDPRSFYVWIALIPSDNKELKPHFYIFHHTDINKFDNLDLESYQGTDNQKTSLHIDENGLVLNKGRMYDFTCFNNNFYNNFEKLDESIKIR